MVGVAFIDLKKTFDTVDYSLLCRKQGKLGAQNKELHWFESYLSDRSNFVELMEQIPR